MAKNSLPEDSLSWLTDDIITKLEAITKPHINKKRTTVIKLAFAKANNQPLDAVFNQPDTCARIIWYTKWKNDPAIKAAYEACYERALGWNDEQTVYLEAYYRSQRRQSVAKYAAEAPASLADVMRNQQEKGGARISAANALITWADPEAAGKAQPAAPPGSGDIINNLINVSEDDLDKIITNLQTILGLSPAAQIPADADK
jgi:hypothetical protein